MEAGPSQVAERLVALLIPPACREHVLGDLCERYRSSRQYALDAARTIPFVIWSQVRRTSTPALAAAEFCVVYVAFLAAAGWLDAGSLGERLAPMRLAIPALAALAGLVLRDAYASGNSRPAPVVALDALIGVLAVFVSQAVLAGFDHPLALSRAVTFMGGFASVMMLSVVRVGLAPALRRGVPAAAAGPALPPSRDGKPSGPQHDLRIWWWMVLAAGLGVWLLLFLNPGTSRARPLLGAWLAAFILIGLYQRRKIRWPDPPREQTAEAVRAYRGRLAQRRDEQSRWPARRPRIVAGAVGIPLVGLASEFVGHVLRGGPVPSLGGRAWIAASAVAASIGLFLVTRLFSNRAARAFQRQIDLTDSQDGEQKR